MEFQSEAEIASAAASNGWDNEKMNEQIQAFRTAKESQSSSSDADAQAAAAKAAEDAAAASQSAGNNGGDQPQNQIPLHEFEVDSVDALKLKFNDLNTELKTAREKLMILGENNSPFATEEDAVINTIKKTSGITDHETATLIARMTPESAAEDKILAITLARAILEPDTYSAVGYDKMRKSVESEFGMEDEGVQLSDHAQARLDIEVAKSLKTINQKRSEFSESAKSVLNLFRDPNAEAQAEARLEKWKQELPSIATSVQTLKETIEVDGKKIDVSMALEPELIGALAANLSDSMRALEPDEAGRAQLTETMTAALILTNVKELMRLAVIEDRKTRDAEIEEKVLAENGNRGHVKRSAGSGGSAPVKSPAEQENDRLKGR